MQTIKCYQQAQRDALIVLAFFPALWGIFSLLNNLGGFAGTAEYAVYPMLNMKDTYGNPAQIWRAIDSLTVAKIGLMGITTIEALAGVLGFYAIFKMIKSRRQVIAEFDRAKTPLIYACLCAIAVWGLGFMVIAGDWFLAWQAKENPLATQLGGMIYTLPCLLTLLACMVHKENT